MTFSRLTVLLVVVAAIALVLGHQVLASSPSTAAPPVEVRRSEVVLPGTADLDPALRAALGRAATDAAEDGVELVVTSGRRTPEEQEHLLQEAITKYGSEAEAARWVATPKSSAHVSGDAVDLGPVAARAWLSEHGAAYGLCQVYRNEPWHYELRPEAIDHGCPPMHADAAR